MPVRASDFDFDLPDAQIARFPADRRDESRLLCLSKDGAMAHGHFADLPDRLEPSDLLVVNDSAVFPARLRAHKVGSGGRVELLLVEPQSDDGTVWLALLGASKRVRVGQTLALDGGEAVEVRQERGGGFFVVEGTTSLQSLAERHGAVPLPPYLGREPIAADRERYQTVYADPLKPGSVAAPTAGLHFTPELLARLQDKGIERVALTLHVGPGTFLPVRADEVAEHRMHHERFEIAPDVAEAIRRAARQGRRVVAVGTTTVRVLESFREEIVPGRGTTDLFIRPGHEFRWVNALITNFHLPRSTLVMLVAALIGRERLLAAYAEAIERGYRFYSYGDAMLVQGSP